MLMSMGVTAFAAESQDVTATYTPTATITSVSLIVDGTEYSSGTVTIDAESIVQLKVYGTNLDYATSDNSVWYATGGQTVMGAGYNWKVYSDEGYAVYDVDVINFVNTTTDFTPKFTNNNSDSDMSWTDSSVTVVYDSSEDAVITGVSITVDGIEYTSGNVTVYSDSTVSITAKGSNLQNSTENHVVKYSDSGNMKIYNYEAESETSVTAEITTSDFASCSNFELLYCNDWMSNESWQNTGIYVTYSSESKPTYYNITIDDSISNGSVTASSTGAAEGTTVTLTITPENGYELSTLTVGGENVTNSVSNGTYSFTMPASDVTISATFIEAAKTYTVTVDDSDNGSVSADADSYTSGATVTLTIAPTGKYTLASLVVSDGTNEIATTKVDDTTYTFVMPAADVTVTATFEDVSAKITGVTLTVDGVTYTGAEGEGYAFINPNSDITVSITGVNLNNMTDENIVYGQILYITGTADWVINENGTAASIVSPASEWTYEYAHLWYDNSSSEKYETTITVVGLSSAGTDLTTIYFNNMNAWETITATFYTDTNFYDERYTLGTAELSLVGGESVVYSTSSIPNNAAYVTFSNGTDTTDLIAIPMASANTPQYNMDGTWSEFVPTSTSVTSVEITWGSMSFTYDDTVDAATGEEKGWTANTDSEGKATNWVTVTNTGETTFTAQAAYTSYEGFESIGGSFTPASSELAIGGEYTFTLELSGKPTKALSGDKIGKVTITINEAAEG